MLVTGLKSEPCDKISAMFASLRHLIGWVINPFRSRQDLMLENLALRQQLLALDAKRPGRRLSTPHKLFWVILRRLWSGWKTPLVLVTPRTVVECIERVFAAIGNGSPEPGRSVGENP